MSSIQPKNNTQQLPLPRYTSYPPANFFHTNFTEGDYRSALQASNGQLPDNLSIYLHIPFCHKLCHYCGCHTNKMESTVLLEAYTETLLKEMAMVFRYIDRGRKVSQVHFGGGSPTSLSVEQLARITGFVFQHFGMIDEAEIAIECHPAHLDLEYLKGLQKADFNRISLGIQDFDPQVLRAVNRDPSQLPVDELIRFIHADMNASVNLDFIYGLPGQTPEGFLATIREAVSYAPDRLVTFPYAHHPQLFKRQAILEREGLPSADDKQRMFDLSIAFLQATPYKRIGMDHFVLPDDELWRAKETKQLHRNFQGYCSKRTTGQVLAFGVSGISQLSGCYVQNTKNLDQYMTSIAEERFSIEKAYSLNKQELLAREIIASLLCNNSVNWQEIASNTGCTIWEINDLFSYNESTVETMRLNGWIEVHQDGICVTSSGENYVRNVAACFDPLRK